MTIAALWSAAAYDAALAFTRESQSGVVSTALQNAPPMVAAERSEAALSSFAFSR
jgi:hypothetical protein